MAKSRVAVFRRKRVAGSGRAWEKTFPDELWAEFGRLSGRKGNLNSRPKWWGKLVIEMITTLLIRMLRNILKTTNRLRECGGIDSSPKTLAFGLLCPDASRWSEWQKNAGICGNCGKKSRAITGDAWYNSAFSADADLDGFLASATPARWLWRRRIDEGGRNTGAA